MTSEQILKIFSPILSSFIGITLKKFSESKPKLVAYVGHISSFTLEKEKIIVNTHGIIIKNNGNKSSKNVKIGHLFLPDNVSVFPQLNYEIKETPGKSKEIIFDSIVPKEQITISYLYYHPITFDQVHSYIKSEDGYIDITKKIPTQFAPSASALFVARFLMFTGLSLIIYLVAIFLIN